MTSDIGFNFLLTTAEVRKVVIAIRYILRTGMTFNLQSEPIFSNTARASVYRGKTPCVLTIACQTSTVWPSLLTAQ
jgi:hypothetical protein